MLRSLAFFLVLGVGTSIPFVGALAQTSYVTLVGDVSNALGAPLANARVMLDGRLAARTAADGVFNVSVQLAGEHVLTIMGVGYSRRDFRFRLSGDQPKEIDLGPIRLSELPIQPVVMTGTVVAAESHTGVANVPISINGEIVALTETDGTFRADLYLNDGQANWLAARRIGYAPHEVQFSVSAPDSQIRVDMELMPLPLELEEIVVSAGKTIYVPPRLAGFYRRQSRGVGHFFTQEQIASLNPFETTALLRHVPGVTVAEVQFGRTRIYSQRSGGRCQEMLIYVDGVRVSDEFQDQIDALTDPRRLAGVEVYTGTAQIPLIYNATGSACGVVLLWTR